MTSTTRRTLVRSAVWTTPVIALATAAPAFSVSEDIEIVDYGQSCKYPGQSVPGKEYGYHMVVTFNANQAGTVTITSFNIGGAPTTDITPKTFAVGVGNTTVSFDVFSSNSAQRNAVITYVFTPTGGVGKTYTATVNFNGFHPC